MSTEKFNRIKVGKNQIKITKIWNLQLVIHILPGDELEKKIEKLDSYQGRIMQAVVKQAFVV